MAWSELTGLIIGPRLDTAGNPYTITWPPTSLAGVTTVPVPTAECLAILAGTGSNPAYIIIPTTGLAIRNNGNTTTLWSVSNAGAVVVGVGLTVSAGQISFTPTRTVVSAAGADLAGEKVNATTITLTGTTQVTTVQGFVNIGQPTLTDASAVTVDGYATLNIAGPPIAAGSVTITTPYALRIASGNALFGGSALSNSPSGGVGYATGAGGTCTQITSKATTVVAVPNPSLCGSITTHNATLNAATIVSFTFTNSAIAATDVLVLNHISGGTIGSYTLNAQAGAGSATINIRNNTAGNLGEALVIQYAIIKGVNA